LFMASRAQLTAEVIRPALDAGRSVVSDRFTLANIVYQGYAGGIDPERLRAMGRIATDGLEPDLTFVLDLAPELALERRRGPADRVESRSAEFHARVRAGFGAEAERRPDKIFLVDASHNLETVQQAIRQQVTALLSKPRAEST
jgi:dTMP kinase